MLSDKRLFLFDIDGTLAVGDTLYPGSAALLSYIASIGGKAYFITNNSTKSNSDYADKFKRCFHLSVDEPYFITSGYMARLFLKKHFAGQKIFVLGTASFLSELRKNALTVTTAPSPDIACVIAAYDSELTYQKLSDTCRILSTMDVPFYATNPDLCCPVDFGFIPDCGSICEMITHSVNKKPLYLGKPNKEVVQLCMERSGFSAAETLVVGDRLYTDIACGINAGVETCAVLTGETSLEEIQNTSYPPDYVYNNIQGLLDALLSSAT